MRWDASERNQVGQVIHRIAYFGEGDDTVALMEDVRARKLRVQVIYGPRYATFVGSIGYVSGLWRVNIPDKEYADFERKGDAIVHLLDELGIDHGL